MPRARFAPSFPLFLMLGLCASACGGGGGAGEDGEILLAEGVWPSINATLGEALPDPRTMFSFEPEADVPGGSLLILDRIEDGFTGPLAELRPPGPIDEEAPFEELLRLLTDGTSTLLTFSVLTSVGGSRGVQQREAQILGLQVPDLGGAGDLRGREITAVRVFVDRADVLVDGDRTTIRVDAGLQVFGR